MSIQLIQQYYSKVEQVIRYGGSRNEQSLRKPFQDLLEQYARARNLVLVAEVELTSKRGTRIRPDGTLKDALRQDWGFWESKDEKDVLADEIAVKIAKGYPTFNILFEDTQTAVLFQGGEEVLRSAFTDAAGLDRLLTLFISYEPREVREFHKAIELFSAEIGGLAEALRAVIGEQLLVNKEFTQALGEFLELCKQSINPNIQMADIREMIIQHVLTEDIFMRVFDEAEFHRENVIAHKLAEVAGTFYRGETKRNIHARIAPYYETINAKASQISDHHEKQKFLKALYENFYKAYNPKAADRLGIVYTPDEIVRFMIESADHLTWQHFGKGLGERGVEILDPATGTGTFISELIEYLPPAQLEYKYEHELHCNEVAILPYYIANLNIEYTFKQKTGHYKEFNNICFVDTLDNMGFEHTGQQLNFFGLTDANAERITRQNSRPIMVVIGNPPYNDNQMNENENNKNRPYPEIDERIKNTYIKNSSAQKTHLYDMYTRFLRWASDRISKNGIVAFVSNNSFIDARAYDGFRKVIEKEFSEIHIVNLKGNARTSGERRQKEGGNIFSDQIKVGIAVYFLIRKEGQKGCRIYYTAVKDYATSEEKKSYLSENNIKDLQLALIYPDKNHNWIDIAENSWGDLLAIDKVFSLTSPGLKTNRDDWVYDFSKNALEDKVKFFIEKFNNQVKEIKYSAIIDDDLDYSIKWSSSLKTFLAKKDEIRFDQNIFVRVMYRPFVNTFFYSDKRLADRLTANHFEIFGANLTQPNIIISMDRSNKPFNIIASNLLADFHFNGDSHCLPLYRYTAAGERTENITDWALNQFKSKYEVRRQKDEGKSKDEERAKTSSFIIHPSSLTKTDIFHYVYAVLHHPAYRAKYEQNLKREFPRIPFYEDFWQWAGWGERLMTLHLGYETVEPWALERSERRGAVPAPVDGMTQSAGRGDPAPTRNGERPTPRLIARKESSIIEVDSVTTLQGVPAAAWEYRLGTYSALEWVLERYKEKKPKDPTIAEKFNTYKFADYKEQVIDLLGRVCRVSVETMAIIAEMPS